MLLQVHIKNTMRIIRNVLKIGFVFSVAMLLFGVNGKAYIDPSVTSYVIQAVAGIAVAVAAVVGIFWRRARKKVKDKLGVEEKKEQESDDLEVK